MGAGQQSRRLCPASLHDNGFLRCFIDGRWWVAGGWALDLFLGHKLRPHADLEISVLASDQATLFEQLRGWDLRLAAPGASLPAWDGSRIQPPFHQVWARHGPARSSDPEEFAADPTMLGFLLEQGGAGHWAYRRHPTVTRPLDELGAATADGVDRIEVVAHDPAWTAGCAELGRDLRAGLGDVALRIDHIGSTSVPGLAAKPIIDIQISVAAFEPLEAFKHPLERLGYVYHAGNPERTKRYFREPPGRPRTHVHVRRAASCSEQGALLFRDYLRAHAEVAAEHAALKRRLAARFREDRRACLDAKGPFVWEVMRLADGWAQVGGWHPGPSDA